MKSFMQQLKDYWFLVLFIGAIIIWFSSTNNRLEVIEKTQAKYSTEESERNKQLEIIKMNIYLLCIKNNVKCKE